VRKAATGWGATDAQAGWADREAEAQWGGGQSGQSRRKEEVGCGWAESPDGPAGCWAGWAESEEIFFRIKFDF
jgi:hypothetical protein